MYVWAGSDWEVAWGWLYCASDLWGSGCSCRSCVWLRPVVASLEVLRRSVTAYSSICSHFLLFRFVLFVFHNIWGGGCVFCYCWRICDHVRQSTGHLRPRLKRRHLQGALLFVILLFWVLCASHYRCNVRALGSSEMVFVICVTNNVPLEMSVYATNGFSWKEGLLYLLYLNFDWLNVQCCRQLVHCIIHL